MVGTGRRTRPGPEHAEERSESQTRQIRARLDPVITVAGAVVHVRRHAERLGPGQHLPVIADVDPGSGDRVRGRQPVPAGGVDDRLEHVPPGQLGVGHRRAHQAAA